MKEIKNYILLVDYKNPYKRNTAGRYRVAAKSEEEAIQILRSKIGFGSIQVYYKCKEDDLPQLKYKEALKEIFEGNKFVYEPVIHANAPHKERKNKKE